MARTFRDRFNAKVDRSSGPNACWPWTGSVDTGGYGHIRNESGKMASAHRLAFEIAFGYWPGEMHVLHRCDNPRCVNPSHLFLGTHEQNMLDMASKGRAVVACGEKSNLARLSED